MLTKSFTRTAALAGLGLVSALGTLGPATAAMAAAPTPTCDVTMSTDSVVISDETLSSPLLTVSFGMSGWAVGNSQLWVRAGGSNWLLIESDLGNSTSPAADRTLTGTEIESTVEQLTGEELGTTPVVVELVVMALAGDPNNGIGSFSCTDSTSVSRTAAATTTTTTADETLPATGTGSTDLTVLGGFAVLLGSMVVLVNRRRSALRGR